MPYVWENRGIEHIRGHNVEYVCKRERVKAWKPKKARFTEEKYLWAFVAKHIKMVYYHYNNGSRSSELAKSFLEYFMGTIFTDGYTIYRMLDGEDSKVLHIFISRKYAWVCE